MSMEFIVGQAFLPVGRPFADAATRVGLLVVLLKDGQTGMSVLLAADYPFRVRGCKAETSTKQAFGRRYSNPAAERLLSSNQFLTSYQPSRL